jgi:hypothetical protein
MPYSTDWPERCCEKRITKPVETEQSDPHGRQRERIKDRSRPVCCSFCLLQSQGFVPRALGLWLNLKNGDRHLTLPIIQVFFDFDRTRSPFSIDY